MTRKPPKDVYGWAPVQNGKIVTDYLYDYKWKCLYAFVMDKRPKQRLFKVKISVVKQRGKSK